MYSIFAAYYSKYHDNFLFLQLFDRRIKLAKGREADIMQTLNEKYMSDEETDTEDPQALVRRSPSWRSEKLNKLIQKLDERYIRSRENKDNSKPMKVRKVGSSSTRSLPPNAPRWAVDTAGVDDTSLNRSPSSSSLNSSSLKTTPNDFSPSVSSTPLTTPPRQGTDKSPLLSASFPTESDSDGELDTWIMQVTGVCD